MQIVDILTSAGVTPERIILGHMECSCPPKASDMRLNLAEKGCYLQFDSFAVPKYVLPRYARKLTDEGRVGQIVELVNRGFGNQILVSHDSLTVDLMAINGGPGIVYIPNKIVPLMRMKGLSEEEIRAITVNNPARALSIT
jgi:phosphotriesterase-related protein